MHIDTLIQEYVVIRDKMRKAEDLEQKLRKSWMSKTGYMTNKKHIKTRKSWLSQLDVVSNLSQKANKSRRKVTDALDKPSSS